MTNLARGRHLATHVKSEILLEETGTYEKGVSGWSRSRRLQSQPYFSAGSSPAYE
jgi:hypothetical protein